MTSPLVGGLPASTILPAMRLPLTAVADALDAWQHDPRPATVESLRDSLAGLVAARGADGTWLRLEAPPLPELELGVGSLAGLQAAPAGQGAPATGLPGTVAGPIDLHGDHGRVPLGRAWIAGPEGTHQPTARLLELVLDLAWSRAEAHAATERFDALDAATAAIATELSLDRVLQVIVDRVRPLVSARYAALGIVGEHGVIERFITSGIDETTRRAIGHPPRGHGILGIIVRQGVSLRLPDLAADPRAYGMPPGHPDMHSFLGVPVTLEGRPIGNLYLTDKQGAPTFSAADQRLVEMFARHAGVAIHNARLHHDLQHLAVLQERERIGQDLHDGIIQALYAVGLSLEDAGELMADDPSGAGERVERAIDSIHATIRDIRNFIFGLRPELLEDVDLRGGLANLADEFRRSTLIPLDMGAQEGVDLDAEEAVQVLQLTREALSNVARHAEASGVTIELGYRDGILRLVIGDDGRGFEPTATRGPAHHGLNNMRARAESLGGTLTMDSRPGAGTRVIFQMPLDAAGYPEETRG